MKIIVAISVFVCLFCCSSANFDANCFGTRKALVHLFEWRWVDIAEECERFLGPKGFCGIQVSPPNEYRVVMTASVQRPWWERYQPVSYKIFSRSGDEEAFKDMVSRCNEVGVRIYVDAILNHMTGEDAGSDVGIAGTQYDSSTLDFPAVSYSSADFHTKGKECKTASGHIESYKDADQVRNCRLVGLVDLKQEKSYVRQKMLGYLNKLIGFGVAGFRFDAAKHMDPEDLEIIIGSLDALNTQWFKADTKPFVYQEVIDLGGEPITASEYYGFARVTEFYYGKYLSEAFSGKTQLKDLKTFGDGYGSLMPSEKALVFIDNHDNQRGHGAGGDILNFFNRKQYQMAVSFMLAHPYGQAQVMSSYEWDRDIQGGQDKNDWVGPPHDTDYNILPVTINADGSCGNRWVCEHRWHSIANMVHFRNVADTAKIENWWDDADNQIAFSRGSRGFFAVNGGSKAMSVTIATGMKTGHYCDIISGELNEEGNGCTGHMITVGSDGKALISISSSADVPMIAFTIDSMLTGEPATTKLTTTPKTTTSPKVPDTTTKGTTPKPTPAPGHQRTVVFMKLQTSVGQDLFLRGGISGSRRPACEISPDTCWIPIDYSHVEYSTAHYAGYNAWSKGDKYLDWAGAESSQGSYIGKKPEGSPMAWTTNSPSTDAGYNPLNQYGMHYWMLDVSMDCGTTENGWFEVKGFLQGRWEGDITQAASCTGSAEAEAKPYTTNNHMARCGFVNVFSWGQGSCQMDKF